MRFKNRLLPKFEHNNILKFDLGILGLFWYNPFNDSKLFFAMFNFLNLFFTIIPAIYFIVVNVEHGYEKISKSVSETIFANVLILFNALFFFNYQKVRVIITDLKLLWKACEFPSFFLLSKDNFFLYFQTSI